MEGLRIEAEGRRVEQVSSATSRLYRGLFVNIFLIAISLVSLAVALLWSDEAMTRLLYFGATLGAASAIAGLAKCLAVLGLRLRRRLLLLPYLAFDLACTVCSVYFVYFNLKLMTDIKVSSN